MTQRDKNHAELLLLWARTLEDHGLMLEAWAVANHVDLLPANPPNREEIAA